MEYKIETPIMLWKDYNPTALPLNLTILNMTVNENIIVKEVMFTVDECADGSIRAYAKLSLQKGVENAPTILYIPTGEEQIEEGLFTKNALKDGYNVAVVDFGGFAEGKEKYTIYPESMKYCVFAEHKDELFKPKEAAQTPWFTWIKVIRRAITMMCDEPMIDADNIVVAGYIEGAQLAWSAAGIDGRVKAVIPVGASGYAEFARSPKYGEGKNAPISDEMECWLAGISAQAYAKLVMCPVLYMAGTNSTFADIDRTADLFSLVPSKCKNMLFSANLNQNITLACYEGALEWLRFVMQNREDEILTPELTTYVSDGKLYASVKGVRNAEKIQVFYALDEINPSFRNWNGAGETVKAGDDENIVRIKVYEDTRRVFALATVTYKNKTMISTPEVVLETKGLGLSEFDDLNKVRRGRVIFNGSMSPTFFSVETSYPVVDDSLLKIKKGPFGIKGVCAETGKLCTYKMVPPDDSRATNFILQTDIYSDTPRVINVNLYTAENGSTKYGNRIELTGSPKWQRVNMTTADFKMADMRPLKDWSLVRKMEIDNAENVIFNNMLWV